MESCIFHSVRDEDAEITFSYNKSKEYVTVWIEDHANNTFISGNIWRETFAKLFTIIRAEIEVDNESETTST